MPLEVRGTQGVTGQGRFQGRPFSREKVLDEPEKSAPLRVLVVEDEMLIRWSVVETLKSAGHEVVQASNGASAINLLKTTATPIDVVLLDYRLPDSSDLGLLAAVRRLSPESSVVMMTAFGTPELKQRASDLGVFRVLSKPFDMQEMSAAVSAASRSRSQ